MGHASDYMPKYSALSLYTNEILANAGAIALSVVFVTVQVQMYLYFMYSAVAMSVLVLVYCIVRSFYSLSTLPVLLQLDIYACFVEYVKLSSLEG